MVDAERTNPPPLLERISRGLSASVLYIDRNRDLRRTLLLAGSGRSGSTWLAEAITRGGRYRLMFEPFHPEEGPLAAHLLAGQYVDPSSRDPALLDGARAILTGRVRHRRVDSLNTCRFPDRRLIKDNSCTNLVPWLVEQFPDVPIVYLLRHPFAVANSRTRLGWRPLLRDFSAQTAIWEGPFAGRRDELAKFGRTENMFLRHVLSWCLENAIPLQLPPGAMHIVFYERAALDPEGEFARLTAFLGEEGRALPEDLGKASATTWRSAKATAVDASRSVNEWQHTIDEGHRRDALAILEAFGLDKVYGPEPLPIATRAPP